VTFGEWRRAAEQTELPPGSVADQPVTGIRWARIRTWLKATSFRLPTESEWEYACRAGSTTPRYGPLDSVAWYVANSSVRGEGLRVHRVGQKQPNAWGCFDMLGNAWELCSDRYFAGSYRRRDDRPKGAALDEAYKATLRGGGFSGAPNTCRASWRRGTTPAEVVAGIGFRVVRDP
jgi:formylglycine-generating enzyme required for sulfatase activity